VSGTLLTSIAGRVRLAVGFATLLASVFGLAAGASPAAAQNITSFSTTLIETNVDFGKIAVSGIVTSAPAGESFSIETRNGISYAVEVSPATTYVRANPKPAEEANPATLSTVVPGDFVGISGGVTSSSVTATGIVISSPQAGGHPDLFTSFSLENPGNPEAAQNVIFNAPTGVFGNPRAITQCAPADFALNQCPPDSQAGLITIRALYKGNSDYLLGTAPIFLLLPQEGETARFSFVVPVLDIPIAIPVAVRTGGDYGLRFTVKDISQLTPLASAKLTFWGFPADEVHNAQRFPKGSPGDPTGCPEEEGTGCNTETPTRSSVDNQPLVDNPTTCSGEGLKSTVAVQTYQDPSHLSQAEASYPPIEGCDSEVFKPVLQATPTTEQVDSASGLDLDLKSPQFLTFAAEPSEIKAVTVSFPPGFTVNPDAADGQSECKESEANFGSEAPAHCPDQSKIGTFSIGTPALPERLGGFVYIGEPKPGDQYRLFLTASGFGINSKLIGSIKPDPQTGQLQAFFTDLPQAPFEDFQLHLFSGERGLMATPTHCTVYPVTATFYPWNTSLSEQETNQIFSLKSGPHGGECPGEIRRFKPTLQAGTSNATAGSFSAFSLELGRDDGDQFLGHLGFTMPPGLSANLRGVAYCPEAAIQAATLNPGRTEQAHASCPAASEIGTSNVAAGPGIHPFHATGKVYMAGPFQGGPLSLVVVTPALPGPYDYGTVVVRVAIHIDPLDAHVAADSEAIPQIIGGIPLRIREIRVNIDRHDAGGQPNFMINPTNCSASSISSHGIGDQRTVADFSSLFQPVNCATLAFRPKMTIHQLGGRKATKRGSDPSLAFDLNTRPGDANIKSLAVTLPKAFEIDQRHLGNLCSKAELESKQCAGRQPIGTVKTVTPLLEKPLEGPAYAVSGYGGLPHVVFILAGQVTLMPQGESKTINGGNLRTEVAIVPDAPIGHFRLTLFGGKHGYIANTRSLCVSAPVTLVEYIAQNGKSTVQKVPTKAACGGAKAKRHKRRPR
jgi:hypothetical protein